jgi:hypothetical protein
MLVLLLAHGAYIDAQITNGADSWRGCTLLDMCDNEQPDVPDDPIVLLLLDRGARVHANNSAWIRDYHSARQLALARRRDAAVAMYLALRAMTTLPRDLLRLLMRWVMSLDWREWRVTL